MKQLRNHQNGAKDSLATATRGIVNLPTGTGKTIIQSRTISDAIATSNGATKVYVVLSPRILLSNQLLGEVKDDLVKNGQDCQYLVVHSGNIDDNYTEEEKELNLPYREVPSTLSANGILSTYEKAVREGVPMIISSTYHSAERIVRSGIPCEMLFCDEAHYLVQEQFAWIVRDPFPARKTYFFTATLRVTAAEDGMGMNNTELFGDVLYQEKPIELIEAGEMVRPRMHLVDMSHSPEGDEADGLAVVEAFKQHQSELNVGAKMLVVAKDGSRHLNNLATHSEVVRLRTIRPDLKVFDISSEHGARIDGGSVSRSEFLSTLQGLKDADQAIIIHCDILSEGIDVPGITGVMPLKSLKKSKFLQTLGRSTRLHIADRIKLYAKQVGANDLGLLIKPYAWLIIPVYGDIGADLHEEMRDYIIELRDHGFDPAEDIMVRQRRGQGTLVPIRQVTEPTEALTAVVDFAGSVMHDIESEEAAALQQLESQKVVAMAEEDFWADLVGA